MKLKKVTLKQDCRPPGYHSAVLTSEMFDLSFEGGLVRATRIADGETELFALSNCVSVKPADEVKPKAAKAA